MFFWSNPAMFPQTSSFLHCCTISCNNNTAITGYYAQYASLPWEAENDASALQQHNQSQLESFLTLSRGVWRWLWERRSRGGYCRASCTDCRTTPRWKGWSTKRSGAASASPLSQAARTPSSLPETPTNSSPVQTHENNLCVSRYARCAPTL